MPEPSSAPPNPSVPGDEGTTLSELLDAYQSQGFGGAFRVTRESELECGSCGQSVDPTAVVMSSLRRLEGASDPDDMLAVVALTCPRCAAKGTVTLGYGPGGSAEDGDILRALDDRRGGAELPAHSAPGEAAGDEPQARPGQP